MYGAIYHHTHLEDANLSGADLHYANLSDVSLRGANFRRANLQETILSKAILDSADLNEADLRGARGLTDEQLEECRKRGAIIKDEVSSSDHSSVAEMSKSQVDGVQFQPPTPTQEAHFSPSDAEQIDSKTGFGRRHD